ncbi:hypothetical protein C8R46DRAFT_1200929 [Mycena filopes]|nr:hypothetical protein C8R46DRAFT_1200929 [Mycena filopes]
MDLVALLNSNSAPDPLQVQILRGELAAALSELSDLDKSLETVEILASWLQQRQTRVKNSVATLTTVLSPIRVVPSEILAAIFQICCDDARAVWGYSITDVRTAPMVLTHVSSRWRAVCLSTQNLWDQLNIRSAVPSPSSLRDLVSRSGSRSLYLRFVVPKQPLDVEVIYQSLALLLAEDTHARVEHLRLDLRHLDPPFTAWKEARPFPRLCSVKIDAAGTSVGLVSPRYIFKLFDDAPLLRHVEITAPESPPSLWFSSAFKWSQLTNLMLRVKLGLVVGRNILIQCLRLTDCDVLFEPEPADRTIQALSHPCRFPELHSLTLHFDFEDDRFEADLLIFFAMLEFPSAKLLTIGSQHWPTELLPDLHRRSFFELEELTLMNIDLRDVEILPFLQLLPSLQTIDLECYGFNDDLLTAFTFDPANSVLALTLPHLRSLAFLDLEYDTHFINVSGVVVANLAESVSLHPGGHNKTFPVLRSLTICLLSEEFDSESKRRLQHANDTGSVRYSRAELKE